MDKETKILNLIEEYIEMCDSDINSTPEEFTHILNSNYKNWLKGEIKNLLIK